MPAVFTHLLVPSSGGLALCAFVIWRLFPDGLTGVLREWSDYRTAALARKLAATAQDPHIALTLLRAFRGTGRVGTESNPQDPPPDDPTGGP